MSLNPLVVKTGATRTLSGGTDLTWTPDGRLVPNSLSLVCSGDTNMITRRGLVLKATAPALAQKVGDYAKLGRGSVVKTVPFIAADGKLYKQTVRIEVAFHSEFNATTRMTEINDTVELILDTDLSNFWTGLLLS